MSVEITHEPDRRRFAARDGLDEVGRLTYVEDEQQIVLEHTIVDPGRQGEGIAGQLAEAALGQLGASGKRIVPECTYIAQYVRRHPEHLPLTQR